ncbi:MAG: Uncharacterised protein [Flavobacteriia bacterium]|nr:MAG: Uncharacterised protein [Flavobacteriia bacterium]
MNVFALSAHFGKVKKNILDRVVDIQYRRTR